MSPPSKKERAHAYHFANKDRINAHRRHIYQQKKDALSIHMVESHIPTPTPTTFDLSNRSLPFSNHNETILLPSIQTEATTSHVHTNHLPSLDYPSTSQTTSSPTIPNTIPPPDKATHSFNENNISQAHQCFRLRLDKLQSIHVCSICKESYLGLHFRFLHGQHTCSRCYSEEKKLPYIYIIFLTTFAIHANKQFPFYITIATISTLKATIIYCFLLHILYTYFHVLICHFNTCTSLNVKKHTFHICILLVCHFFIFFLPTFTYLQCFQSLTMFSYIYLVHLFMSRII